MIASSEQERTEYLGIAYHKNLDLQRLIHNLFEVTRMEGGTIVYHPEWVCAGFLIKRRTGSTATWCGIKGLPSWSNLIIGWA